MEQIEETFFTRLGRSLKDLLYSPFWFIYLLIRKNISFKEDFLFWRTQHNVSASLSGRNFRDFLRLISTFPEFRSLIYFRLKNQSKRSWFTAMMYSLLYKGGNNLYIMCSSIGGGFFILHGYSTSILAERIGDFFWVHQQVTIGALGNHR